MATGKPNGSSVFWWVWLERFWQDLRHGARMFAKNPGFTAIAVISIAFGTGANVAIFSVADALILRPLPVARPNELVTVGNRTVRGIFKSNVASYPDYADIRDRSQSFDGLVAFASERVGLSVSPKAAPELRIATLVSGNFFRVLGAEPQLGRGFLIGRVILSMVAAMGLMGVALIMVGLYGLVSYAVSRRTREIGIRIAIGASHERVLRMVLRQGMTPVWFGMFAGIGLSLVTLRVLPRVIALGPHYDSRANFLILPTLLLVTILAVLAPSLRAARVEPAVALRVD